MKEIQPQLDLVTTEIQEVSSQIKNVEFYLKKPMAVWTDLEKEEYGSKEHLLEKVQLLKKEVRQQEDEEQLRE
jgi:hypothetical protein